MKNSFTLLIDGMTCNHCESTVTGALEQLGGQVREIDADTGIARFVSDRWIPIDSVTNSVESAGYSLKAASIAGELTIPVQGMQFEKCRKRITGELLKIDGVERVVVHLDANQVIVSGSADLLAIIAGIRNQGYEVAETVSDVEFPKQPSATTVASASEQDSITPTRESDYYLQIQGMSCASCVLRVENTLSAVPGVSEASVNFADETAFVKGATSLQDLVSAVQRLGYGADLVDPSVDKERVMIDQFRKGIIRSVLALVGGSLLMAGMMTGLLPGIDNKTFWLITGVVVLGLMVFSGGHFYRNAWHSAKYFTTTMDTLIALGTGTAWLYSMLVIIAPMLVPEASRHLFFEAALFIVGFINLGKSLELNARGKASGAIEKLLDLAPDEVTLLVNDEETRTSLQLIKVGDSLRIKPGDRIPVDGRIIDGFSSLDESMLSGEPIPVDKQPGDSVAAGTINLHGSFVMLTEQVGRETTLARMVSMVKQAQNSKPPIGKLTDSIASVFVPFVLLVALVCIVYWGFLSSDGGLTLVIVTTMSVLIIACPCALGLAIPISIMVGIGRGASRGLLVRNSDALQAAAGLDTIVLDKTGTLTEGKPEVVGVSVSQGSDENRLLGLAYSLESYSEHPLAKAVINYCEQRGISKPVVSEFRISPGGGVSAEVDGVMVRAGNRQYLVDSGIGFSHQTQPETGTVIYIAEGSELLGSLDLDDKLKPDSKSAVAKFQAKGIHVVILSGDNAASVSKVAAQLNISDYHAGLTPEAKLEKISEMQRGGQKVAMVGDGINDAPALGIADVGFAMGDGTDIAIESADVAVVGNRLSRVVEAIEISRQTMRNIYQNLFGAFAYNIVLIPVAAGVLYPLLISPTFAGFAMAMSSVTVVANANRLRFVRLD